MSTPRKRPYVPLTFLDMLMRAHSEMHALRGMISEEPGVDRHLLSYASDAEATINAIIKRYHQAPDNEPKETI